MTNRTKIIISALIGGAALASAVPAQAQSYPQSRERYEQQDDRYNDRYEQQGDRYNDRYEQQGDRYDDRYEHSNRYNDRGQSNAIRTQIEQLAQRIQHLDGRDRISEREAAGLRQAIRQLRQQYRDYSRNGLSRREVQVLQNRIQQLRQRLSYERRDNDGRRW